MNNDDKTTFKEICRRLCEVTTVVMYDVLKGCLDEMSKKYNFLEPWINWWHERCSHIFGLSEEVAFPESTCPNKGILNGLYET